ncbi:YdbH domain-containing protein [uncultured Pseudoteredinibacter sp.]|uniref:intermembrane phospholipid transport protein YdbH family protein n=1 Tax=uncultured Pseudoteredinibacter sp. TaxID=1641701 RepID=UPI002621D0FB|nr:YdbH domain-containing protein [uncultured Pseudoteredinibacter sp.]
MPRGRSQLLLKSLKFLLLNTALFLVLLASFLLLLNHNYFLTAKLIGFWRSDIKQLEYQAFEFSSEQGFWWLKSPSFSLQHPTGELSTEQLKIKFKSWHYWPKEIQLDRLEYRLVDVSLEQQSDAAIQDQQMTLSQTFEESLQQLRDLKPFKLRVDRLQLSYAENSLLAKLDWQHGKQENFQLLGHISAAEVRPEPFAFELQVEQSWQENKPVVAGSFGLQDIASARLKAQLKDSQYQIDWQGQCSISKLLSLAKELPYSELTDLDSIKAIVGEDISAYGKIQLNKDFTPLQFIGVVPPFSEQSVELKIAELELDSKIVLQEKLELQWLPQELSFSLGQSSVFVDGNKLGKLQLRLASQQACNLDSCLIDVQGSSSNSDLQAWQSTDLLPESTSGYIDTIRWSGPLQLRLTERLLEWQGSSELQLSKLNVAPAKIEAATVDIDQLAANMNLQGGSFVVNVSLPKLSIETKQLNLATDLLSERMTVSLEDLAFSLAETFELNSKWKLDLGLSEFQKTPVAGLQADGELKFDGQQWFFNGLLASDKARPILAVEGSHQALRDKAEGALHWQMKMDPFTASDSLAKRFGHWPLDGNLLNGRLRAMGRFAWQLGSQFSWKTDGELNFEELGGVYQDIGFLGLQGQQRWQLNSAERVDINGSVALSSLDIGLELNSLGFQYQLSDLGAVTVKDFRASLLDGQLSKQELELQFKDGLLSSSKSYLDIEQVKLQSLLAAADYDGLDATATLSGRLPFAIKANQLFVEKGKLSAIEPGYIRYSGLADSGNPLMDVVSEALSNYHYEQLTADVEYDDSGYLQMAVVLKGKNPDFQDGRQVNLNLNISDNVPNLIKSLQAGRIVTDVISEKLMQ